jgi:hypothetical protein
MSTRTMFSCANGTTVYQPRVQPWEWGGEHGCVPKERRIDRVRGGNPAICGVPSERGNRWLVCGAPLEQSMMPPCRSVNRGDLLCRNRFPTSSST